MGIFILLIDLIYYAIFIIILARIIFQLLRINPYHPTWGSIMRFVYETSESIMAPVRNILPPMGGLDLSPIIILFGIRLIRNLLITLI